MKERTVIQHLEAKTGDATFLLGIAKDGCGAASALM